jgi:3-hydroxyacyl-[acyl-carrier-protein] dehydratase
MKKNEILKDDLYTIDSFIKEPGGDAAEAVVRLNAGHHIFSGHFPGNPVLPGVCLIQIIKEILSDIVQKDIMLVKSSNIKFLNLIDPTINKTITISFKIENGVDNGVNVDCHVTGQDSNLSRFKGEFRYL